MRSVQSQPATADYGIDAPPVVFTFVLLAFFAVMAGIFIGSGIGSPTAAIGPSIASLLFASTAGYMVWSSKVGKGRLWDRVLDDLDLAGDERALDVGCGRGLVLIKLAKRLTDHSIVGVDVWRSQDQSGNVRIVTEANARVEGVGDRIDVHDADMRRLPFPDQSFDLITASLTLHHLRERTDRVRAVAEMVRVLRPGGRIVVVDIAKIAEHHTELLAAGFDDIEGSVRTPLTCPPSRVLIARRHTPDVPG